MSERGKELPEENCTTYAANETRDLTGPYGFGRIFQLRSPAEGHQERGMGIGLKRVLAVALIVVFLCSVSVASAAGSLLPFDHEWTAAEVRARIAAGARVNARDDDGWTPLMFAAEHSDVEAVTALLEAGANVNARSAFGWTALMSAALYNTDPHVIARLVEAGASVNVMAEDGSTPLILATYNDSPAAVGLVLAAGADVDVEDIRSWTALMYAAGWADIEAISALLEAGADVNARSPLGWTPLMSAVSCGYWPAEVREFQWEDFDEDWVWDEDEDWEWEWESGWTALMMAATYCESPDVILALLEAGADGKLKSQDGMTAFDYANDNESIKGTDVYWLLNEARF